MKKNARSRSEKGNNVAYAEVEQEAPQEIEEEEPQIKHALTKNLDQGNIVKHLGDDNAEAYQDAIELYDIAKASMEPWKKKYQKAINLAKLQPTVAGKPTELATFPFQGASLAMMPYILEAALDFNSRAAPELVWADDIVTTKVYGKDISFEKPLDEEDEKELKQTNQDAKTDRGDRVSKYMNYQLNEEIPDWRDDQDKALFMLPIVGTFYKKTYRDYDISGICSELVKPNELIFDMSCSNFSKALHKFQDIVLTRNELMAYIRGAQKWVIDEDDLEEDQDSFEFIEAYTYIDLDKDGVSEPYIAILDQKTLKIVCLYPNYDEDTLHFNDEGEVIKIEEVPCFTQYRFLPDPEGGPMGMGWGILLGPMFTAINSNIRQLLDSGIVSLTASNSGLIAMGTGGMGGNRQASGPIEVQLGQLTPVPMGGVNGSLRENIVQMPFSGPSSVLMQLLDYLVTSARGMTNAAINVEANAGEAASLYLARLQQGLKVPNSIIARVFDCSKKEFQKIHALNHKYHDSDAYNKVLDEDKAYLMEEDFNPKDCDVRMAGNPAQGSDIERVARTEANLQLGHQQHAAGIQVLNIRQLTIDHLKATKTENIDELAPPPPEGPSPEMQAEIAREQMEAEIKKEDQELRKNGQRIQREKMAMEAAKEMTRLGLDSDKQEAEITKKYMESLKLAYDMGMNGIPAIKQVERTFIDAEGGNNARQIPTSNPNPDRPMARGPGNENAIPQP